MAAVVQFKKSSWSYCLFAAWQLHNFSAAPAPPSIQVRIDINITPKILVEQYPSRHGILGYNVPANLYNGAAHVRKSPILLSLSNLALIGPHGRYNGTYNDDLSCHLTVYEFSELAITIFP